MKNQYLIPIIFFVIVLISHLFINIYHNPDSDKKTLFKLLKDEQNERNKLNKKIDILIDDRQELFKQIDDLKNEIKIRELNLQNKIQNIKINTYVPIKNLDDSSNNAFIKYLQPN